MSNKAACCAPCFVTSALEKVYLLRILIAALLLSPVPALALWQPAGTLKVPSYFYSFLAATPSGDLLCATFNSTSAGTAPAELPALLIRNPMSDSPQVFELCRTAFEPQRGYGGIACAADGSFFVSGDTGTAATCFLRKYRPDGTPDAAFGTNGEIRPNRRCLGVDTVGSYLLLVVDWGEILVFDAATGRPTGAVPRAPGTVYVRDIALDPSSMRIFGVAQGSVVVWENGNPWEPQKYVFRKLSEPAGEVRAGEGISFDPQVRNALIQPVRGNVLLEVSLRGETTQNVVSTADATTHLADSVLSFDGTTLFVSDIIAKKIHVLLRSAQVTMYVGAGASGSGQASVPAPPLVQGQYPAAAASPAPQSQPAPPSAAGAATQGYVTKTDWKRSYLEIVEQARAQGRPMIVYFRQKGTPKCVEFESSVLLTPQFDQRAQGFMCVFEDLAFNRLFAYRFGVFRVPYLVVLDPKGETAAQFSFDIDQNKLFAAMEYARGKMGQ